MSIHIHVSIYFSSMPFQLYVLDALSNILNMSGMIYRDTYWHFLLKYNIKYMLFIANVSAKLHVQSIKILKIKE